MVKMMAVPGTEFFPTTVEATTDNPCTLPYYSSISSLIATDPVTQSLCTFEFDFSVAILTSGTQSHSISVFCHHNL